METPYAGRAIVNEIDDGIEIIVPADKNRRLIIFYSIWLCDWLCGMIFIPVAAFGMGGKGLPIPIMAAIMCFWAILGFASVITWWWYVAGKEVITIKDGVLIVAKKGVPVKPSSYDLSQAKNFRAEEDFVNDLNYNSAPAKKAGWNLANQGTLKFDYEADTVRFGDKLLQAEWEYILERLRAKKLIG